MPWIPPEFEVLKAKIPDDMQYEGTEVDPNVMKALPSGTKIIWAATHGASFWAISFKIEAELLDGSQQSYFMKIYITPKGKAQALGEYESTKALNEAIPENVPRPIGVGVLSTDASKHFLLVEFKDMADELPPVPEFAAVIAKLHKNSVSPNGKFGFSVPTSQSLQLDNSWCDTWEEFFTRAFRGTVKIEQETQGYSEELEKLAEQTCAKVIPRLLRPMETGGRTLKPALVHGDLWHGNVGVDMETDLPILYDCCAIYGHHEYDMQMWRQPRYRTNKSHVRAYHKISEISAPAEDHDDRNALYAMRMDLEVSCGWSAKKLRLAAMEEMRRLIEKYPDGFEGYEERSVG